MNWREGVPTEGVFFIEGEDGEPKEKPERSPVPGEKPNRWTVPFVQCLDCDGLWRVDESIVNRDVGRPVGDGNRFVMLLLPETCPRCRNLKAIK